MGSASAIFNSHITHLPQIVSYMRLWRKNGGTKVEPWCKHSSWYGWQKDTSQDEAMLISEEIKSIPLAVLEVCLSEGISEWASKWVSESDSKKSIK